MAQAEFEKDQQEEIYREFHQYVNMTVFQLEQWLQTRQSQEVGYRHEPASESVGHESGRKIITILGKKKDQLDSADYAHMRKVVWWVT